MSAKISSRYYADAGMFTTEEESRYSLNALHLERHPEKGVIIVATDGHTMGVFHDIGGQCPEDGITLKFDSALANLCSTKKLLEINDDGSASIFEGGLEEVRFSRIVTSKNFPEWKSVLPKWTAESERIDYNPEYFGRCAKAGRATYPRLTIWSGSDGTQVTHGKERAAVVVEQEQDDRFFLVAQMRRTDKDYPPLIEVLRLKDETDLSDPEQLPDNAEFVKETKWLTQ